MTRTIAMYLLGKREAGELGYWKKVSHIERKLKEMMATAVVVLTLIAGLVAMFMAWVSNPSGYYAPDYMDANGTLYDTDGDGDYYHWVEE